MTGNKLMGAVLWGSAFIIAGVLWLLSNLGVIKFDIWQLWPLVFVIIGVQIIIDGFGKQK
jgi:hypothetical protein